MFTGIIEAVGKVVAVQTKQGDISLRIATAGLDLSDVKLGDSIATNGVCLTVVDLPGDGFWADVSQESLLHTRIAQWQIGTAVNLEKALTLSTRLGGHLVTGHVDGVGTVVKRHADARSIRFTIEVPKTIRQYIAPKGSITVDGVSLTVNALADTDTTQFELNIVPHTAKETTLYEYAVGQALHIEVDIIARYLERLVGKTDTDAAPGISQVFLAQHGFWK